MGAGLKRDGVIDAGVNAGDSWYVVAQMIKKADLHPGPGAIPEEVLAKFRADNNMPKFSLATNLYGTDEEIAAKAAVCKAAFRADRRNFHVRAGSPGRPQFAALHSPGDRRPR